MLHFCKGVYPCNNPVHQSFLMSQQFQHRSRLFCFHIRNEKLVPSTLDSIVCRFNQKTFGCLVANVLRKLRECTRSACLATAFKLVTHSLSDTFACFKTSSRLSRATSKSVPFPILGKQAMSFSAHRFSSHSFVFLKPFFFHFMFCSFFQYQPFSQQFVLFLPLIPFPSDLTILFVFRVYLPVVAF